MKRIKDILDIVETIVAIGFFLVAAYTIYWAVFVG